MVFPKKNTDLAATSFFMHIGAKTLMVASTEALAIAYCIKSRFRASDVNSFTYTKVAHLLKCSRERAKRALKEAEEYGLLTIEKNRVVVKTFRNNYGVGVVGGAETLKIAVKSIELTKVRCKQNRHEFAANTKLNRASCKKAYNKCQKRGYAGEVIIHGISNKVASRVIGRSTRYVKRLKKDAVKQKHITIEKQYRRLCAKDSYNGFDVGGKVFLYGDYFFLRLPDTWCYQR